MIKQSTVSESMWTIL